MKFQFLLIFSLISLIFIGLFSPVHQHHQSRLDLRQEIQILENNALKNILIEQDLSKRSSILETAMVEVQKLRNISPQQLNPDEKAIEKIVQNLKAMSSLNQAQY